MLYLYDYTWRSNSFVLSFNYWCWERSGWDLTVFGTVFWKCNILMQFNITSANSNLQFLVRHFSPAKVHSCLLHLHWTNSQHTVQIIGLVNSVRMEKIPYICVFWGQKNYCAYWKRAEKFLLERSHLSRPRTTETPKAAFQRDTPCKAVPGEVPE